MAESRTTRRRKGRMAFFFGGNPDEINPYKGTLKAADWLDGWNEAQAQHESYEPSRFDKARDAVNDRSIFSDDQVAALHAMLHELENGE